MVEVSLLVPALSCPDAPSLSLLCAQTFGVAYDLLEVFALVPISEWPGAATNVAVRIKHSALSLQAIEDLLVQREQMTQQLDRSRNALQTYAEQVEKLKQIGERVDAVKYHKRGQKIKQLDEDNKKLRTLLKAQLENSENLRKETQQTVETLRQEFDLLVRELMAFRKKVAQVTTSEGKGRKKAER
jgi:DNA repair ATPase RecN